MVLQETKEKQTRKAKSERRKNHEYKWFCNKPKKSKLERRNQYERNIKRMDGFATNQRKRLERRKQNEGHIKRLDGFARNPSKKIEWR